MNFVQKIINQYLKIDQTINDQNGEKQEYSEESEISERENVIVKKENMIFELV